MRDKYEKLAKELRRDILRMHASSGNSHIGCSFSSVEILVALYYGILRVSPKECRKAGRDRLIFSKGHAASSLYAVLAKRGFFPKKMLNEYCADGGRLAGHCVMNCAPGVEVSTGSLGHGLSIGAGLALGLSLERRKSRVFVVLSDGECQEGSVWEAAMFASQHKLDNLVSIIDYNKIQAFGRNRDILDLEPFKGKWQAFGWQVKEVDGHNTAELIKALRKIPFRGGSPNAIIAHTIKGKGISFMENNLAWHYKSPNKNELAKGLAELI